MQAQGALQNFCCLFALRVLHVLHMKRDIRSFEAEADVAKMLNRAKADGIKQTFLINEALRHYLTVKGFSRKRDLAELAGKREQR